jgi:hypothetical protein
VIDGDDVMTSTSPHTPFRHTIQCTHCTKRYSYHATRHAMTKPTKMRLRRRRITHTRSRCLCHTCTRRDDVDGRSSCHPSDDHLSRCIHLTGCVCDEERVRRRIGGGMTTRLVQSAGRTPLIRNYPIRAYTVPTLRGIVVDDAAALHPHYLAVLPSAVKRGFAPAAHDARGGGRQRTLAIDTGDCGTSGGTSS